MSSLLDQSLMERLSDRLPQREVLLFPRGRIALPATFHVAGVGSADDGSHYDNDGLKRGPRSFVLLKHTLSGSGRLRFGQRQYVLTPGQTMLVTVPHDHRYWLPRGGHWSYFWLCLHGHEALHICKHVIDVAGPVLNLSEETLASAARAVLDILGGDIATPTQASTRAYDLIMRVHGELKAEQPRDARERTADLEQAISYCRENISRPIGVADLAKASGYSRYHFARRFQESEGIPPAEFLRNERMSLAARALAETDLQIAVIAEKCGYLDPSYFTKVFRRVYGIPPKAFRHRV